MKEPKVCLKFIEAKGKNKRIDIFLVQEGESKYFILHTKTLQDRKTRSISETKCVFSVGTFTALNELMNTFLDAGPVKNKLITKELRQIEKFKAVTNINL
jgi:hypothetical protein